jgi:hypothetical protein
LVCRRRGQKDDEIFLIFDPLSHQEKVKAKLRLAPLLVSGGKDGDGRGRSVLILQPIDPRRIHIGKSIFKWWRLGPMPGGR